LALRREVGRKDKERRHGKIFEGNLINNEFECEELNSLSRNSIQDWVSKLICRDGGQGGILAQGNTNKVFSISKMGGQAWN
jgi:hypothetical protein